jgi:NADPH:quinone reductase-like Zn-dependent oxidoreductase
MRAVISTSAQDNYNVAIAEVAEPEPGPGQVQVAVAAAAVNPVDRITAQPGLLRSFLPIELPPQLGLGWDLSGTISGKGADVTGLEIGQPVIGLVDKFVTPIGAQSEYVVLDVHAVAPLPADADLVAAATLPANASTALQALRLAEVTAGTTLVVTGAAGAVGGYLVEYGAALGARVIGIGRPTDEEQVRKFGADEFVAGDDLAAVRRHLPDGAQVIIDSASLADQITGALADGGTFIAVSEPATPKIAGARVDKVSVRAVHEDLTKIVSDWRAGSITARVAGSYRFEQVAEVHDRLASGGVRGRLVLVP